MCFPKATVVWQETEAKSEMRSLGEECPTGIGEDSRETPSQWQQAVTVLMFFKGSEGEPSYTVGGNVNRSSTGYGKWDGGSLKK